MVVAVLSPIHSALKIKYSSLRLSLFGMAPRPITPPLIVKPYVPRAHLSKMKKILWYFEKDWSNYQPADSIFSHCGLRWGRIHNDLKKAARIGHAVEISQDHL